MRDRVPPISEHALRGLGGGGNTLDTGAESEFAAPAADDEPLDPAPRSGGLDEQVQAVSVRVSSWRGGSDEGGGQRLVGMAASALRTGPLGQRESKYSHNSLHNMELWSIIRPSFPRRFPLSERESTGPSEPSANCPAPRFTHSPAAVQNITWPDLCGWRVRRGIVTPMLRNPASASKRSTSAALSTTGMSRVPGAGRGANRSRQCSPRNTM